MMRQLSLKVLLSFLALMFSASVGLSAVYECRFYARTQPDPTSGLMTIDAKQGTVTIASSNAWISKEEKGPHKVNISDNGSKFSWTYRGYVKTSSSWSGQPEKLNVEIELDRLSDPVEAVIIVELSSGLKWKTRERYLRNVANCKIRKSGMTNASVEEQSKSKSLAMPKYECTFSNKFGIGPADGKMFIDTGQETVDISGNSRGRGINGSYKLTELSDGGTLFKWTLVGDGSTVWYKLKLEAAGSDTNAQLNIRTNKNSYKTPEKNSGPCKLIKSEVAPADHTAKIKAPIYECKYLRQDKYTRDLVYKIDIKQKTLTILKNSIVDKTHKITLSNKGNVISWIDITNRLNATNTIFKIVLKDPNVSTEARYETFTFGQGYTLQMNCKLLQPIEVAAVATPSETEASKPNTPDALEAVFLTQQAFDRRNIQLILSDLSFYKSTIDGLYGSGTENALYAYNDEYFRGSDLTKEDNVNALFEDILSQRVLEVKEPASLDNLIEQIDDIVGGELEPGEVELSE